MQISMAMCFNSLASTMPSGIMSRRESFAPDKAKKHLKRFWKRLSVLVKSSTGMLAVLNFQKFGKFSMSISVACVVQ